MGFADDWGTVYNKSILAFTGRKKVGVRELEDVVKGTSPLVKSLIVLDQNDPSIGEKAEHAKKLKAFVAERQIKLGEIVGAVRVALTGSSVGFGLYDALAILGCERSLQRIERALAKVT